MTAIHQRNRLSTFLAFMVKHQYKVMFASFVVGCIFVVFHRLLAFSWFFSRFTLLLAIYAFVPAGCVLLAHLRERFLTGWFYWDKSNVAWTTRRAPKIEKIELIVLGVLGSSILIFLIVVVFFLAND